MSLNNVDDNLFLFETRLNKKKHESLFIAKETGCLPKSPYNIACGVLCLTTFEEISIIK